MIASLLIPLLLQSGPISEPPPVPEWNCEEPLYQQEMNWCAGQDYFAADSELNAQWKITVEAMKASDAEFAADRAGGYDKRQSYLENLREAQRGWLRYRDGHCALEGYAARGGSMEPMLLSGCKARLTRQRAQELREVIGEDG
jgi:uncharacterized protein YecT (DUF1311 family)